MTDVKQCSFYSNPDYYEYLIEYRGDFLGQISKISYACGDVLTEKFAIVSVKAGQLQQLLKDVPSILFINFRNMFVLQSTSAENTSNIEPIKLNPNLNLSGSGVLVGLVDTGIDYLNKEFIREDGTTRIESIWDQTIVSDASNNNVFIGTTYSNNDINKALDASSTGKDPYSIVPSKDTNGHGTQMAGIVGARGYNKDIRGIAHDCNFVIVKLAESATFKRDLMLNGITNVPVYNTAEFVAGLEYLRRYAISINKPMIILIGIGSSDYSHDGTGLVARYINELASYRGLVVVTSTGNQGAADLHASGYTPNVGEVKTVELKIVKALNNFSFKIWVRKPNKFALNVISPSGQSSKFIPSKINQVEQIKFIYENTFLDITFFVPDNITGLQVIILSFTDIKPGIWKFQLKAEYVTDGRFDIWLSPEKTLPAGTKFLSPDPYVTLTVPSASKKIISVGYYNHLTDSIVSESGKGYPLNNFIKPDIVAPGIDILTTNINNTTTLVTGSSVAASIVAGVCALLVQWGIIDKNDSTMYSPKIINYLITGASRKPNEVYPNPSWGYGKLDVAGIFNTLSGTRSYLRSYDNYTEYYINNLFIRIPKELEVNLNE
ncbi:S8 family peptidase [Clostridium chauvoei]|uniref:S8 family peptidase n=2 Tax=Clostridium chauvoei TaxID=46867 RepID=A0ABD4RH35_9CLOT|nr:S8 family peptidase [Clostridium chauvoei]ATD55707.1 peptidase S8 and S53 subtilisin kexin sedolisin [Clostridium chauvoei]ATD56616.1 peptidase S8 and S53 subtilisin kexin sedolisin [Clostridium chauvoei]MBX7280251.1 S8 family peptidase [Clostridium chauvoei]MBX7282736.1 S8 family peptidase [Clostridium chauvoei]MBX7285142.1 S8 family peptidase [Clostridium chauvoei]